MDGPGKIREKALNAIKDTRWLPAKGETRITAMIEQRPDWCISRQREWGVPIALFLSKKDGQPLKDEKVLNRIADIFEQEGSDAWWQRPAQDFLGNQYSADDYEQVFDIVDVWFESGSTHAFVLAEHPELQKKDLKPGEPPIDLYLEGSDQHRGWFHSSLLESCGTRGHAPYKAVLTHGFVLDEKGYKMSKSLGNVVDPLEMMQQHGADIIRLWTMLSDYSEDIRIGKDTLKLTADLYRRIRNTFRYLLGALDGFSEDERVTDVAKMPELERLVLHWLHELDGEIREHVKNYEFGKLAHRLHNFCTNELSAFYFDIRKDSLYCDRPDDDKRRACRTVMAHLFDCLTAWLAPILAFTAEEAWGHRPAGLGKEASVHLRIFPNVPATWKNQTLSENWKTIRFQREGVFEVLEDKRKDKEIGSSLQAKVTSVIHKNYSPYFKDIDWAEICIVSQASIEFQSWPELLETKTDRRTFFSTALAEGNKCARCWKVLPEVGKDKEHKDVCLRCADAVREFKKKDREAA
jgi:isoleucyl-tRNA synthetase